MLNYIAKRILAVIPVLFIISIVVFSLIHLTGGSPASSILGMEATEAEIEALNEKLGLNKPVYEQYLDWIKGVLKGDLGESYFMEEDVKTAIFTHIQPTLELAVAAMVLAALISIPLGMAQAYYENSLFDKIIGIFTLTGLALPSFVISILFMLIFSVILGVLPVAGYREAGAGLWNHVKYMILPAVSLAIGESAYLIKTVRATFLEEMNETYIKTARVRGDSEMKIMTKEVFKNALLPIITVIGQSFGSLVAGAIIVETVFNIPGLGRLLMNSLSRRDLVMIQGIVLVTAALYVLINLITDIIYTVADPRIDYGDDNER